MAVAGNNSERIGVRTPPNIELLLRQIAVPSRRTVTEFPLEAGIDAAEDALIDRRMFRLGDKRWRAFRDVPDRPVSGEPRLPGCRPGRAASEWHRGVRICPRSGSSMRRAMSSPSRAGSKEWRKGR